MERMTPEVLFWGLGPPMLILMTIVVGYGYWPELSAFGRRVAGLFAARQSVKRFTPPVMPSTPRPAQTDQTDRQTDLASADPLACDRLQLDRTRETAIDVLVYNGWSIKDLRAAGLLRGDNGKIGEEVAAARQRLGLVAEDGRQLVVRDGGRERVIPFDDLPEPRRRQGAYYQDAPELEYEPPN
jgi:hypothetical protein